MIVPIYTIDGIHILGVIGCDGTHRTMCGLTRSESAHLVPAALSERHSNGHNGHICSKCMRQYNDLVTTIFRV